MARTTQPRKPKPRRIVGGVDTHADTHHAAVVLMNGTRVADAQFPATQAGYARLWAWLSSFGRVHAVGVEGTGSYGKAVARHLAGQRVRVVEVNRPDRSQRRAKGKSDPLDAYAAAEAVLAQRATATPKAGGGIVEAIRCVHVTRAGAVKARTMALNELKALLVTAPPAVREDVAGRSGAALVHACARLQVGAELADPRHGVAYAARRLAARWQALTTEIRELDTHLRTLVDRACPSLPRLHGVGYETAAQLLTTAGDNPDRIGTEASFAALCGVAPVPASSGKLTRHRLSQGGDRQANRALYVIACTRLATDPTTRAYRDRRLSDPDPRATKTTKEVIRCLKRAIARQIYRIIQRELTSDHVAIAA